MKQWTSLPAYLVRVAGFAFDRLAALRCAGAAEAADALDRALETRLAAGRTLDETLSQERYAENPAFDDPATRKVLSKHVKQARAFARTPADTDPPTEPLREVARVVPRVAPLVDELVATHAQWREAGRLFADVFGREFEAARSAIRAMYRDERMQEAVFLESPEAFERIVQLVATDGPRNSRARQRERLAAMYAQRFCAKNDTNSFCGPHGVAYLAPPNDRTPSIEILKEDARRETYFSHWAAQRLLDEAVQRAGDAAPVTLRLHPTARVENGAVAWCVMDHDATTSFKRRYARSELPRGVDRLLRALAQPRTRSELAALATELELDREELDGFLDSLVDAGLVLRGPLLAPGLFAPLREVATEVTRWPDGEARTWLLGEVAALEDLLASFARAPLSERLELFNRIAMRFESATGDTAQRGDGRHYADRSVLHEDVYVEVSSELGPARAALDTALPSLVAVLELPLELARERVREWFRARFGEGGRVSALAAHRAFDEDRVLETPATSARAASLRSAIDSVRDAIGKAVASAGDGTARLSTAELDAVLAQVSAPTHAGYISVDVMLRRPREGATEVILGEVHGFFWLPTCLLDVLPPEHRERVVEQMRTGMRDLGQGKTTAETVFLHTQATDRRFPLATTDLQMIVPTDRPDAVDLGALEMRLDGDEFTFWRGDEEVVPLVAYARYPFLLYTSRIAPLFDDFSDRFFPDTLLPESLRAADAPRLAVDDLVVRRRIWRRPAVAVRTALTAASEADLFRRAQAFRRELGCGPIVFASLAGEPKPVLLDFADPFLVEALVNILERQADDAAVKFSEMLPGPDELAAHGPDGARTCELRMGFYRSPHRP